MPKKNQKHPKKLREFFVRSHSAIRRGPLAVPFPQKDEKKETLSKEDSQKQQQIGEKQRTAQLCNYLRALCKADIRSSWCMKDEGSDSERIRGGVVRMQKHFDEGYAWFTANIDAVDTTIKRFDFGTVLTTYYGGQKLTTEHQKLRPILEDALLSSLCNDNRDEMSHQKAVEDALRRKNIKRVVERLDIRTTLKTASLLM